MTDIVIQKGSTWVRTLRWESLPWVYTPITAITKAAPMVVTAAGHGLVTGWRAGIVGVVGMRQANSKNIPPRATDLKKVTFVSSSQVSFNDVVSLDYSAYVSGGALISYTPVSLSGFTARMQIRVTADATTTLDSLVSPTDIVLDDTNHTITITISATDTAAYDFTDAVYDLELVSGAGVVTRLLEGNVTVLSEVTR